MANRDFEIDLKMKADFSSADRALKGTESGLQRVVKATADANAQLAAVGNSAASSQAASTPETAAQAAQTKRLREMVRASLEYQQTLVAQVAAEQTVTNAQAGSAASLDQNARARQAVASASQATQAAITAEIGLIGDLQARLDRGAGSYDDLAETEAKLDVAMQKGLISAQEYEDALEQLNAEQQRLDRDAEKAGKTLDSTVGRYDKAGAGLKRLAVDEQRLKVAVDAGRISREQYNKALAGINTERARLTTLRDGANNTANAMRGLNLQTMQVQQNISQLVRFGVTGQWQAAGTQLLSLGNRAGVAGGLFTGAGIAIAGTAVAIGGVAFAAVKGYLQMRALETALIATGNAAGVTAGELADMRNEVGESTGRFADAQKAMELLAGSGVVVEGSMEAAGRAAVNLSVLTKRSIEDTTAQVISLAKAPSATLLELNERYNFLTLAVYDNVKSLEDQGRAQDAARVATEFLAEKTDKSVEQMLETAGTLERAWNQVTKAIKGAGQALLDRGREDAEGKLAAATRELARLEALPARRNFPAREAKIKDAQEAVRLAQAAVDIEKLSAVEKAEAAATNKSALDAQKRQQSELLANLDRETKKREEIKQLELDMVAIRSGNGKSVKGMTVEAFEAQRRAQIEEKYKPPEERTRKGPKAVDPDESAKRELANLKQQIALLGELEAGETKASEAARIRYEIENGAYKGASAAVKGQLLDQAQQLDAERRKIELAKQLKSVDLRVLALQGNEATAALQEAISKLEQLRSELSAEGDTAGVAKVDEAIRLETQAATLMELQRQYESAQQRIALREQQIQAQRSVGLISEAEAQRQIIDLYRQQGDVLTELLPKMQAIADRMGGPAGEAARANLARIRQEFEQMLATTSLLEQKAGEVFEGAFGNALNSLATGTKNLGQAIRGLFLDMAQGLAQFASQQLAQLARAKLFSLLGKGKTPDLQSPDPAQAAAAGAAYALPIAGAATALGASAIPLGIAAAALNAAAIALAASGATSGAASSGADLLGAFLGPMLAEGGAVAGPGTSTSDSILARLSNGEFVSRAAVVAQPGALAFLSDFNSRGMAAIEDWKSRFRNAPSMGRSYAPKFNFADGGLAAVGDNLRPTLNFRNITVLDKEDIARAVSASRHGEMTFKENVMNNANFIRSALDL